MTRASTEYIHITRVTNVGTSHGSAKAVLSGGVVRVKVIETSNTGMKMKLGGRHLSFLSLSVSDGRGNLRPKLFLS